MNQVTLCDPPWISKDGLLMVGGKPLQVLRLSPNHSKDVRRLLDGESVKINETNSSLIDALVYSGIVRPLHAFAEEAIERISDELEVIFTITGNAETALESARQLFKGRAPLLPDKVRFIAPTRESHDDFIKGFRDINPNVVIADENRAFPDGLEASSANYLAFTSDRVSASGEDIKLLALAMIDNGADLILPRVIGAPERFHSSTVPSSISHFEERRSLSDAGSNWTNISPTNFANNDSALIFVTKRATAIGIGGFHKIKYDESQREFISRLISDGRKAVYEPGVIVRETASKSYAEFAKAAFQLGRSSVELADTYPHSARKAAINKTKLVALSFPVLLGFKGLGLSLFMESLILAQTGQKLAGIKGGDMAAIQIELKSDAHLIEELGSYLRQGLGLPMMVTAPFVKPMKRLLVATVIMSIIEASGNSSAEEAFQGVLLSWTQDIAYSAGIWSEAIKKRSIQGVFPRFQNVRLKKPA